MFLVPANLFASSESDFLVVTREDILPRDTATDNVSRATHPQIHLFDVVEYGYV